MNKMEIQKVPASHGWLWILHGYRLIMRSPLHALPLSMVLAFSISLAMVIPVGGIFLAIFLVPLFMAGYMRVCRSLEYNEKVEPLFMIAGFKERTSQLMSLGGMLLLGMIIISVITAAMGGTVLNSILQNYHTHQDPTLLINTLLAPESGLRMTLLTGFALFFGLTMAMQFAPMLVFFNQMAPRNALLASLMGSVRNIVPFAVYSMIIQLIAFVVSMIPYGLGWIMLLPLMLTSMYVAYRDIFNEVQPADTVTVDQ